MGTNKKNVALKWTEGIYFFSRFIENNLLSPKIRNKICVYFILSDFLHRITWIKNKICVYFILSHFFHKITWIKNKICIYFILRDWDSVNKSTSIFLLLLIIMILYCQFQTPSITWHEFPIHHNVLNFFSIISAFLFHP